MDFSNNKGVTEILFSNTAFLADNLEVGIYALLR